MWESFFFLSAMAVVESIRLMMSKCGLWLLFPKGKEEGSLLVFVGKSERSFNRDPIASSLLWRLLTCTINYFFHPTYSSGKYLDHRRELLLVCLFRDNAGNSIRTSAFLFRLGKTRAVW
jgi:hypothetical protein